MAEQLYTLQQAAQLLGVSEDGLRVAVQMGQLQVWSKPTHRGFVVTERDLQLYLQKYHGVDLHDGPAARKARQMGWCVNTEDK